MTDRPLFKFPPLSFTAIDIALALGKSRDWAVALIGRMEQAGIARQAEHGKYKFTLRRDTK